MSFLANSLQGSHRIDYVYRNYDVPNSVGYI